MKKWSYKTTDLYTKLKFDPVGMCKEDGGMHCLSLVIDFARNILKIPINIDKDEIVDGIKWSNVNKMFHDNPEEVTNKIIKHFEKHFKEIPMHLMDKGDILIIEDKNGMNLPCVYVGNSKMLIAIVSKGIKVKNIKNINILKVYRGIK